MKAQVGKAQKKRTLGEVKTLVDPEKRVLQLAKEGKLAEAGKNAIAEAHKAGLSPVVMLGNQLFRLHPDGTLTLFQEHKLNVKIGEEISMQEIIEQERFNQQKQALLERAERLKRLTLNISGAARAPYSPTHPSLLENLGKNISDKD